MINSGKRILALMLSMLLMLGMLSGCDNKAEPPVQTSNAEQTPEEPQIVEPPEEARTLKVLTLGHSLALDCSHLLALIAQTEGFGDLVVGTLYYSGCPLYKHVQFMENDMPEYNLYISSTENANTPPVITEGVTMRQALTFDYWDIIVMQGGVFEIAEDAKYKDGNIQRIQKFVNENKLNPLARFAWNSPWAPPTDNDLRDKYPYESNPYYTSYVPYGDDRAVFFTSIAKCLENNILTDDTFEFMIPSGTAIENALSSYLEEKDIHRDYVHATDFSRVIASYLWYCKLAGIAQLEEIKLDAIPRVFFKSTVGAEDRVLTELEKAIILESVNNALKDPLKMTPSQYTVAPTE